MVRFAVVEDDPAFRETLQSYLKQYAEETGMQYSVSVYADGAELVHAYKPAFDILLMDIQMQDLDGMAAAKKVRRFDREVVIVFITNMSAFAIEGYSVDALDYLLKPLTYYAFSQCITRARERLKRREKRTLLIAHQRGAQRISTDELLFVEVHGHCLIYHTSSEDYSVAGTMKEVEEALSGLPFYRCNKCDLVNLAKVDGMHDGDAVIGTHRIQLSRAKKKGFLEALNRYINEVRS